MLDLVLRWKWYTHETNAWSYLKELSKVSYRCKIIIISVVLICYKQIMECVTFDIDLAYERIHTTWVRYKTNLVIFYSYLMDKVCDLFGNDLLNRYDMF